MEETHSNEAFVECLLLMMNAFQFNDCWKGAIIYNYRGSIKAMTSIWEPPPVSIRIVSDADSDCGLLVSHGATTHLSKYTHTCMRLKSKWRSSLSRSLSLFSLIIQTDTSKTDMTHTHSVLQDGLHPARTRNWESDWQNDPSPGCHWGTMELLVRGKEERMFIEYSMQFKLC